MTEEELVEAEKWALNVLDAGDTRETILALVAEVRRPSLPPLRESLKTMRKATGDRSQAFIAKIMGCSQSDIAALEARSDYKVSTLRAFAAALGGGCRVLFDFPGRPPVELVIPKAGP